MSKCMRKIESDLKFANLLCQNHGLCLYLVCRQYSTCMLHKRDIQLRYDNINMYLRETTNKLGDI